MQYVNLGNTGLKVSRLEIQLSREEIALLEEPYVPHPVLGHR
jgi:hypothetical protein